MDIVTTEASTFKISAIALQFENHAQQEASIEEVSLKMGSFWGEQLDQHLAGNDSSTYGQVSH